MKLKEILKGVDYTLLQGNDEIEIENVQYDSRKTGEGSLFVCISGFKTDGHKYIDSAAEKGTAAFSVEKDVEMKPGKTYIKVKNNREALAHIAANIYGRPSEKMNLVGVTGTNGKTSTTYIVKSVLDRIGHKVGVIGTIENRIGDKVIHADRTTPESLELQELFKGMYDEGVTDVCMEVSSH